MDLFAEAVDGAIAVLDAVGFKAQVRPPPPSTAGDIYQADGALEAFVDDRTLRMYV
jgi:hypothetical protein